MNYNALSAFRRMTLLSKYGCVNFKECRFGIVVDNTILIAKSKNMFKFLYYNPLLGFKVMAGILYEALKIIYKGGKYYARKKKPNDTVSFEGNF